MTLYDLTADFVEGLNAYDAAETDEERADIANWLIGVKGDLDAKADAYARIIKNKQAEAKALKDEADRLTAKRRAAESLIERLKAALLGAMQETGIEQIGTSIGKWRLQYNPVSCEIVNPEYIPARFMIPQPDKIDKAALIEEYKRTGEIIDGVEFHKEQGIRFR